MLRIDQRGDVREVIVLSGREPYTGLAVAVARGSRFRPATVDGRAIEVEVPMAWVFPAPAVNARGVVRRRDTGTPVAGAMVHVGDRAAPTDADGRFEVRNLTAGDYTVVVVDGVAWLPAETFVLGPAEVVDLEVWVGAAPETPGVIGTYRRREAIRRWTLDENAIRAYPGALGDPVRAVQNAPGMLRTPFDAGWLLVRGGDPGHTGIHVDGVEVPLLYHLGGFTSIIHPDLVDEVHLHPGAYSPRFARGLSGAVDVDSRRVGPEARIAAGVNLVYASLFAEVPLSPGVGLAVATRRSYLDAILSAVLDAERAKIAPRFWDAAARLTTPSYDMTVLGLSDVATVPAGSGSQSFDVRQAAVQAQGRLRVDLGAARVRIDHWLAWNQSSIESQDSPRRIREVFPGARVELASPAGAAWDGRVGIDTEVKWYRVDQGPVYRTAPAGRTDPYAQLVVGNAVEVEVGARVNTLYVARQRPRWALTPRGGLRWNVRPDLALLAEIGRFAAPPPSVWLVGLPDGPYLPLEIAESASAGARFSRGPLEVQLEGYARRLRNLARFERDGSLGLQDARAWGVSFEAKVQARNTRASLIGQAGRVRLREDPGDPWEAGRYDQPLNLNALIVHRAGRWTLSGRFRYASGFVLDREANSAYDILRQEEVDLEVGDNERLPAFHALDLKVERRWVVGRWRVDTYIDVQNSYHRRVPEPTINGIDDTEAIYGFGLPILPILGFEAEFYPGRPSRQRRDAATTAR